MTLFYLTLQLSLRLILKKKEIDLSKFAKDPNGDKLSFKVTSDNEKVIAPTVKNNLLSFTEGKAGLAKLKIIANDGNGGQLILSQKYLVSLPSMNPPYINNSLENVIKYQGFKSANVDISKLFLDPEGSHLKFKIDVINEGKGWQWSFIIYGIAALVFFLNPVLNVKKAVESSKIGSLLFPLFTLT